MLHNLTASMHPPVKADVLPPHEAHDLPYYEQRLADPHLLGQSVAIRTLTMAFLAVPVGGARRGGHYTVDCMCFGLAVRDALRDVPGFPDVRLRWSPWPDPYQVEWGEKPPWLWGCQDDAVLGRFYGYSEEAIARYIGSRARPPQDPLLGAGDRAPLPRGSAGTAPSRAPLPATFERKSRHV